MTYYLKTPFTDEDIKKLRSGDIVYVSGEVATARDEAHKKILEEGKAPVDFSKVLLYHAGPIVQDNKILACGPTTSMRMESYEAAFIEKYGVKFIVGKGGMGEKTAEACQKFGCVHGIFPGGLAVLAANCLGEVSGQYLPELGMPEAVWTAEAENFGPIIINIDTQGGNLIKEKLEAIKKESSLWKTIN